MASPFYFANGGMVQIVGDRRDCIVNHVHVFRKLENLVVVVVSSGCDALKHIDPSLASTLGSASTSTGSDACLAATYHAHKNIKALDMEQTFPSFSPIHLSHEFQLPTFNLQLLTLSASSSIHEPTQHSPKISRRFSREELSFNEGCKACGTSSPSSPQKPTAEQPAHTKKQPKGPKKLIKRLNEYKTCVLEKRRRKKTLAALNRILDYAVDPSACSDPDLDAVLANIHRLPSRSGHADAQSDGSSSSSLERILTAGKDCTGVCHCRRKPVNMITLDSESESEREDGGDYDADDEDDVEDGDEMAINSRAMFSAAAARNRRSPPRPCTMPKANVDAIRVVTAPRRRRNSSRLDSVPTSPTLASGRSSCSRTCRKRWRVRRRRVCQGAGWWG